MSTAVIISGQARTFHLCLPSLEWHVFRHLHDPHFFCSVADDAQASDMFLLEAKYPGRVHVERVTQPELSLPGESNPATSNLAESQRHRLANFAPYAVSSSLQAILRQLWALNRAWEFLLEAGEERKWMTVVRCRPDLWFHGFDLPARAAEPTEASLPWWARCGGCNDRFGIMGYKAAHHYFTAHTKVSAMLESGCPLHPESLLAESLRLGGVTVRNTLDATFSARRIDGTVVPPHEYPGELAAFIAATR